VGWRQDDQIGRIFAQWAIVYYEQFFENYRSSPHLCYTVFTGIDYVLILTKNGLGYILGHFSQTHLVTLVGACSPGWHLQRPRKCFDFAM
jgi:hypothetical protein